MSEEERTGISAQRFFALYSGHETAQTAAEQTVRTVLADVLKNARKENTIHEAWDIYLAFYRMLETMEDDLHDVMDSKALIFCAGCFKKTVHSHFVIEDRWLCTVCAWPNTPPETIDSITEET